MPKRYDKRVRERAEELIATGLSAKEVQRRIAADTAGLGEKIDIGYRSVAQWAAHWRMLNGPPQTPEEISAETEHRLKLRALALFQREVTALEKQKPGRMTAKQANTLRAIILSAETVQKRLAGPKKQKGHSRKPSANVKQESGSALRELAEQMAKAPARIDAPHTTGTKASETNGDKGNDQASGSGVSESHTTQQARGEQPGTEQAGRHVGQAGGTVKPQSVHDQPSSTSGPGWPE